MWLTKQWRCILPDTDFKNFKPMAAADASRIIIGWPTSAESLYDAFSKPAAKSCAHFCNTAHTFGTFFCPPSKKKEGVFEALMETAIWVVFLCCLTAGSEKHFHSKVCSASRLKILKNVGGFSFLSKWCL